MVQGRLAETREEAGSLGRAAADLLSTMRSRREYRQGAVQTLQAAKDRPRLREFMIN